LAERIAHISTYIADAGRGNELYHDLEEHIHENYENY
jgi:hypothetical protein